MIISEALAFLPSWSGNVFLDPLLQKQKAHFPFRPLLFIVPAMALMILFPDRAASYAFHSNFSSVVGLALTFATLCLLN